ncbi:hypothetical protein LLG46_09265 [bacterium]|nr:hypothetical protein [bacterium]
MPWQIGRVDANFAILDIILRRVGSAFAGDILHILASRKGCLESFLRSIHYSLDTNHIHCAAAQLCKSIEMSLLPCPNNLSYLANKYSREQARQIKYVVEVFYTFEPIFAILAALAQRWIARQYSANMPVDAHIDSSSNMDVPLCLSKIDLPNKSYSACTSPLLYSALAKWPDYAALVTKEIGNVHGFVEKTQYAMYRAEFLSESIDLSASESRLRINDHEAERSIRRCSEMSADTIVVATMLRNGFIVGEKSERDKHALEERWAEY